MSAFVEASGIKVLTAIGRSVAGLASTCRPTRRCCACAWRRSARPWSPSSRAGRTSAWRPPRRRCRRDRPQSRSRRPGHHGGGPQALPAALAGPIPQREIEGHVRPVLTDRSTLSQGRDFAVRSPTTWRIADLFADHAVLLNGPGWGGMPLHAVAADVAAGRPAQPPLAPRRTDGEGPCDRPAAGGPTTEVQVPSDTIGRPAVVHLTPGDVGDARPASCPRSRACGPVSERRSGGARRPAAPPSAGPAPARPRPTWTGARRRRATRPTLASE